MMYEYWLGKIRGISGAKKRKLREYYGDARNIYYIEESRLKKDALLGEKELDILCEARKQDGVEEDYRKLMTAGIRFLPWFDGDYPRRLLKVPSPPYALYGKGRLPEDDRPSVAIVGARKCTPYGEQAALEFGEALARAGVQVVSGLARGIDGAAQRGALNGGGAVFGVLGCGVDVCYPREHIGLYTDIQKTGGLLSEYPPGTPPLPAHFPVRNRIISGLADQVLVMEAREKSGSLITADMALEQGRDVYALPGPFSSSLSRGCHQLIRQGAGILVSPEEFLWEIGQGKCLLRQKSDKNEKILESHENMLYSCLDFFPKSIDQLQDETTFAPGELLGLLTALELKGYAREVSKNYYVRVP